MKRKGFSDSDCVLSKSRNIADSDLERSEDMTMVISDQRHAKSSRLQTNDSSRSINCATDLGFSIETGKAGSVIAHQHRFLKYDASQCERNRIAATLHDGVAQTLQVINLGLKRLRVSIAESDQQSKQMLDQVISEVGEAIEEVRSISHELRPRFLERMALHEAIRFHCDELSKRSGVPVRFQAKLAHYGLSACVKLQCFLGFREALNNALKHANANCIEVTLTTDEPGFLSVSIIDDGKGFDPDLNTNRSVGFGVAMIDERAVSVGGYAQIRSAIGAGTQVLIAVPLINQERL